MIYAIILCAGSGARLGADTPKCFVEINEKPMFFYSVRLMANNSMIDNIVLTCPAGWKKSTENLIAGWGFNNIVVIEGGKSRQESVFLALKTLPENTSYIVIHDGARPCASNDLLSLVLYNAIEHSACVPVIPATDTIKILDDNKYVLKTLDRASLVMAQTPQAFNFNILLAAHIHAAENDFIATDDSSILEHYGRKTFAVDGSIANIKITHPQDIILAKRLLL